MGRQKMQWELAIERRHGGLDIEDCPETVYIICYDRPTVVNSVSSDYPVEVNPAGTAYQTSRPITHYVGWTSQRNPQRRVDNHQDPATGKCVHYISKATMKDEHRLKLTGDCPYCATPLRTSLRDDLRAGANQQ